MGFESSASSREITKRRNAGAEWKSELIIEAADGGIVYPIAPKERVQAWEGNTSCPALEKPSLFVASSGFVHRS